MSWLLAKRQSCAPRSDCRSERLRRQKQTQKCELLLLQFAWRSERNGGLPRWKPV